MIDLVVPTIGRRSLATLLAGIASAEGPRPQRVFVVDDRRDRSAPLELGTLDDDLRARIVVVPGRAAGPAAARNIGWRAASAPWIAFVDDDVDVGPTWLRDLAADVAAAGPHDAGTIGVVHVPLPRDRRPTDRERNVAGLETSSWITADLAYRRGDLLATGGFDERFPRAYREDADLALRMMARGRRIVRGSRRVAHPVLAAPWTISVRQQAGNADDVLMRALHGSDWRSRAGAPRGAFAAHVRTVVSATIALVAFAVGRRRPAALAAATWATHTAAFAVRRIAPGPMTAGEGAAMLVTSVAIPFAAVFHHVRARVRLRTLLADRARAPRPLPSAVLFDRDGTLVVDVPGNADPARVEPMPGAIDALQRLRALGIPVGIVSNQSGIAAGALDAADVAAVNQRLAELAGPFAAVEVCPHAPHDGCACRKPAPGLIVAAATRLGVALADVVVIGDIGADVDAARAVGARGILVPTPLTRAEEVVHADAVAADLTAAVELALQCAS